jgi:hypothetical protein
MEMGVFGRRRDRRDVHLLGRRFNSRLSGFRAANNQPTRCEGASTEMALVVPCHGRVWAREREWIACHRILGVSKTVSLTWAQT